MARENSFVRIEVGFDGGPIMSALVTEASADALDRALRAGAGGVLEIEAQDGTVVVAVPRILYAKRFAREGRVGFEV